jgi:ABC-type enterobactin transport system permease subunit
MKPHLEVMRNTGSAFRLAVPQIEGLLKGKFRLILVGFFLTAILSAFATWLVMYFLPAK